jgi:hypothetical protein
MLCIDNRIPPTPATPSTPMAVLGRRPGPQRAGSRTRAGAPGTVRQAPRESSRTIQPAGRGRREDHVRTHDGVPGPAGRSPCQRLCAAKNFHMAVLARGPRGSL